VQVCVRHALRCVYIKNIAKRCFHWRISRLRNFEHRVARSKTDISKFGDFEGGSRSDKIHSTNCRDLFPLCRVPGAAVNPGERLMAHRRSTRCGREGKGSKSRQETGKGGVSMRGPAIRKGCRPRDSSLRNAEVSFRHLFVSKSIIKPEAYLDIRPARRVSRSRINRGRHETAIYSH